jgi:DNA topoisomerase-1
LEVTLERAIEVIQAKQEEDAPIGHYDQMPITKGKGRFGPFIKWNGLFINIPRAYDFDTINEKECFELIEKKVEKESNRYIHHFPEFKVSVENGRWGPFIKFNKKMLKLTGNPTGGKYTPEEAALLTWEQIKEMVEQQVPNAFASKKSKVASTKTKTGTKTAPKKTATKKASSAASKEDKAAIQKKTALQRKIDRQNMKERDK